MSTLSYKRLELTKDNAGIDGLADIGSNHDNLLEVPCDKEKLVDDASVLHVLEPVTCAIFDTSSIHS